MRALLKRLFLAVALVASIEVVALELPQQAAVPGGIVIIPLGEQRDAPKAFYRKTPVMVVKDGEVWHAVIGIPLSTQSGQQSLTVGTKSYHFHIDEKHYESQHITIKERRKVTPNSLDLERIGREKKHISRALRHWGDQLIADDIMLDIPVLGVVSSPFGLRRFFNGKPRKPHSGIDIAAAQGVLIRAPASGRIINTGDYFFNGNSIFIDHGQGLITMYCHMDRIDLKEGDLVKRGEIIGTIGMTGRVTGPHLHWSVSLNNARIDPTLLVPELRSDKQ